MYYASRLLLTHLSSLKPFIRKIIEDNPTPLIFKNFNHGASKKSAFPKDSD